MGVIWSILGRNILVRCNRDEWHLFPILLFPFLSYPFLSSFLVPQEIHLLTKSTDLQRTMGFQRYARYSQARGFTSRSRCEREHRVYI
jgi:hypothetical protein